MTERNPDNPFSNLRDQLSASRQTLEAARQQRLLANERVKQTERALAALSRGAGPNQEEQIAQLQKQLEQARANAAQAAGALAERQAVEARLWDQFIAFSDPREAINQLSDSIPILLFPLRLETRFKNSANGQPELWLRVFPDTCLVDTFEEALTDQEIANARVFWASIWRAGGDEAAERGAWRNLAAAHGSGRAGWIVRNYQPVNPNDKPVKAALGDVLLIIPSAAPLPSAARDYWQAVWRAVGPGGGIDSTAQQAAYGALMTVVGAAQAQEIAQNNQPFNFNDAPVPPATHANARVKVAVLQLPSPTDMPTRRSSWSSAPKVDLLPERFVFIGYTQGAAPLVALGSPVHSPLVAGPDPNAPPDQQLKPVDDTLQIPDNLLWMFDFERAVQVGMAMRIPLTPQQAASGFDRVIVLGLRMADSPDQGQKNFARLLDHHLYSRTGLEILPQGTPTNNTEKSGSGYSSHEDPDTTFGLFYLQKPQYTPAADPLLRQDGQWLAGLLGLPQDLVQRIPNAGGTDQLEARAMQIALWPGTLGYMMNTLLSPVFSDRDIATTRAFFSRYVNGRGPLPALRIGDQPYGILPATDFARVNWFASSTAGHGFLARLYAILRRIETDWQPLVQQVSYIGKAGGDPQQTFLDVLGLHSGSVEYYPLSAESAGAKFYELAFYDYSISLALLGLFPAIIPLSLLRSFGYVGADIPDLLNQIYRARQTPLDGPLIDDRPLSESDPIRKYAGNNNYIEWLIEAARAGVEQVQQEQGFDKDQKPAALLYLMLRHALQIGFHETAVSLQVNAGLANDRSALLREPSFVHVQDAAQGAQNSESRYASLFSPADTITGRPGMRLGDYIASNFRLVNPDLSEHIDALNRLSRVPTARLERVFAEHIDTVSYRLDAWKGGLLAWELEQMRGAGGATAGGPADGQTSTGLYLGAYGWLEPLRPGGKVLTPVELPGDLGDQINRHDKTPLMRDSTNEGLIHSPSLNHATTAAVLRSGYLANDGRMAINLSSRRMRLALAILEGMRGGQSLGVLLGYQLERYIHDNGPLQVRDLVYPLRRAFPLVANQIQKTADDSGDAKESIAAMNVVDGRKLIEYVEGKQDFVYPFGVATLPRRDPDQENTITDALTHIRDINDAVADLVLAEGVHQAVLGNYDRSAGTLDAFAKGNYPLEPEVMRTPRSGIALNLRTAIHLSPNPAATPLATPLAAAEPALNAWLKSKLPDPALVGCQITYTDRAANTEQTEFISQDQLGLQPADLVYRADTNTEQALNSLDDCILNYIYTARAPRFDRPILIQYTKPVTGKVNWFELQALLRSLRALTVSSRPLTPADLMRHTDASRSDQAAVSLPKGHVQDPRDTLNNTFLPALDGLSTSLANPAVTIDDALAQFVNTVGQLAAYRLPQTGTGFLYEWRANTYTGLVNRVQQRVDKWNERLSDYDARIDNYDNHLPLGITEADRVDLLQRAEGVLVTHLTLPSPASGPYRLALNGCRADFVAKLASLQDLVDKPRSTLAQLLADALAVLPLTDFDLEPLDFSDVTAEIDRFRASLAVAVTDLKTDLTKRIGQVDALLVQVDTAGPTGQVKLLQQAAKIIFGDDFQMIPAISLPSAAAGDLFNAWQYSTSGKLTEYLTTPTPAGAGRDFPVDDWLHGAARVREKLHHLENAILLGESLPGAHPPALVPLQLPYGPNEPWLALEFPSDYTIDSDRLLYTADFAEPFDANQPVFGLLVDEWAEIIPGITEETGITFYFDRPNAEPPQAWLLALPALRNGTWSWDELLGAVTDVLDSAKMRALEPVHIDNTAYSAFLPATVSAYTFPEISISNNLLRNLKIYARLANA